MIEVCDEDHGGPMPAFLSVKHRWEAGLISG